MKLWSYQSPDFSLVDGDYCHDKSEFFEKYRDAYEELWKRVGCRKIIWCSIAKTTWRLRCQWELEVPECRFLKVVDSMVWNGILGHEDVTPGEPLRSKLLHEAMQRHSDSDAAYEDYRKEVRRLLHPPGDPWDSLFLNDPTDPKADILLRHSIEPSWVVSVIQPGDGVK